MDKRTTNLTAGPGGVMTDEVGVVTGDLTLETTVDTDGTLRQLVQYQQADEWYRVTDSPASLPERSTIDSVHSAAVDRMVRGQRSD